MAVAMLVDNPTGSSDLYQQLRATLELDRPLGGTVHLAGPGPNGGWRVIEVWDSVEDASRFLQDRLLPALEAAGFAGQQLEHQFWPVHTCLTSGSSIDASPIAGDHA